MVVQLPWGSGDAAGTDERITALLPLAPFDVRVAVVGTPVDAQSGTDASRYLASALARRIGEPGLYVVVADGAPVAIRAVDTAWDETLLSLQRYEDMDAVRAASGEDVLAPGVQAEVVMRTAVEAIPVSEGESATTTSLSPETVRELAERQADLEPFELPDYDERPEAWGEGARWAAGTTVGVGLLVLVLQSLVGWPGWRRRARSAPRTTTAPADLVTARSAAEAALVTLGQQLPSSTGHPRHAHAVRAHDAAAMLLDSRNALDLVGALVLARAGQRVLRRRPDEALAVCFFDPRHRGPHQQVDQRYGDADLALTACRACARDVAATVEPDALLEPRRGPLARSRPYYEGTSVWARTGFGTLSPDLDTFAGDVVADLDRRR